MAFVEIAGVAIRWATTGVYIVPLAPGERLLACPVCGELAPITWVVRAGDEVMCTDCGTEFTTVLFALPAGLDRKGAWCVS